MNENNPFENDGDPVDEPQSAGASMQMPRYTKRPDVAFALEISDVFELDIDPLAAREPGDPEPGSVGLAFVDDRYADTIVDAKFVRRNAPKAGGYLVVTNGEETYLDCHDFENAWMPASPSA